MDIGATLQSIRYNDTNFPRAQLLELVEHRDEAIPHLLQLMEELRSDYEKVIDDDARIDYVYAYFLLAQFKEKKLFPIMMDLLSKPAEDVDRIFGDRIIEGVGRVLSSVYDGNLESLKTLIENEQAEEYARGQALIAVTSLTLHGELQREDTVAYLKQFLTDRRSEESYYFNTEVVQCCNDLYPEEVYKELTSLMGDQLIESLMIGKDVVDQTLSRPKAMVLEANRRSLKYRLVTDAIEELQPGEEKGKPKKKSIQSLNDPNRILKFNNSLKVEKIGRNDPCPCGSGKKHKKCCG